jgi:transposase InsO family protein
MSAHLNRQGIPVAKCTIELLKRAHGWRGARRVRRVRRVRTTVPDPAATVADHSWTWVAVGCDVGPARAGLVEWGLSCVITAYASNVSDCGRTTIWDGFLLVLAVSRHSRGRSWLKARRWASG